MLIECPYCEHPHQQDDLPGCDGDEVERDCPKCDKAFTIIASVTVDYDAYTIEEIEEVKNEEET